MSEPKEVPAEELRARARQAAASLELAESILEWVQTALQGHEVSDFAESFPLVRLALDTTRELRAAEKRAEDAEEHLTQQIKLRAFDGGRLRSQREGWQKRALVAEEALAASQALALRWKKAVEGLTPGGSEYVNDPERCAEAIRKRCEWPRQIREAQALAQRLAKALRTIEAMSFDSGSIPAPEVVSRIYCVAAAALAESPARPKGPREVRTDRYLNDGRCQEAGHFYYKVARTCIYCGAAQVAPEPEGECSTRCGCRIAPSSPEPADKETE